MHGMGIGGYVKYPVRAHDGQSTTYAYKLPPF